MPAFTKPMSGRGQSGDDLRKDLGQYIRDLRTKRDMTQADLAKAVGITYYTAISAIEVGRNVVPPERYLDFARALGVNPKTFAKTVLRLTNPWLYALLYEDDVEAAVTSINESIQGRGRGA